MTHTDIFIELHYYSGGLKSKITGANKRPEWLPDQDLVGLHNDVFPAKGEYVVELSRHKRLDKLITWVGVYSYGKDDQFGDRANYNGVGAWLIDAIPIHTSSIISALREVCDLLVQHGPVESVQQTCIQIHEKYLPNWVSSIDVLPVVDKGIVFDVTSHPETLYIRADNKNIDSTLQNISSSIERNCIVADNDCAKFSRVLYLLLGQSVEVKNIKHLISLPESYSSTEDLITYFGKSTADLKKQYFDLLDQKKASESEISSTTSAINTLRAEVSQLKESNAQLTSQNNELSLNFNTKTSGQILADLRKRVTTLSIEKPHKAALLQSIDALDNARVLEPQRNEPSQNLLPYLNDIIKRLDALKSNDNKNDTSKYQPVIAQPTLGEETSVGIVKFTFYTSLVVLLALGAFFIYQKYFSSPAISESHQNNTAVVSRVSDNGVREEFKIMANPSKLTDASEFVELTDNAEIGVKDSIRPVYDVIYGNCTLEGKILSVDSVHTHEICKIRATFNGNEAIAYVEVDLPKVSHEIPPSKAVVEKPKNR